MVTRKQAVKRAFGSAGSYDDEAHVQREVAERLARHIAALPLPPNPRILEIGCGTGFLTSALQAEIGGAWTVTDLSPDMVARCRDVLKPASGIHYLAMDGEHPCFTDGPRFDLICSSLAFQWFEDLPGSIARLGGLLAPGGHLAFATMADGSFGEWHAAYRACGLSAAVPDYPSTAALDVMTPAGMIADIRDFRLHPRFGSGHAFLRHLRGIGAYVPQADSSPLSPGALRQVIRAFEASGSAITYHIACCTYRKAA